MHDCDSSSQLHGLRRGFLSKMHSHMLDSHVQGLWDSTKGNVRGLPSGCRRSLGTVMKPLRGGALTQRGFCLLLSTVGPFPGVKCSVWEKFAVWKGGLCFLLAPTNLNLLWSQSSFSVQHNKDTFRTIASFSVCVSYVNAAPEKFSSALHFNSAFKTCKTETQRKTPRKHFGFHLFSIFTSGAHIFFFLILVL